MLLSEACYADFSAKNVPPHPGTGDGAGAASRRELYACFQTERRRAEFFLFLLFLNLLQLKIILTAKRIISGRRILSPSSVTQSSKCRRGWATPGPEGTGPLQRVGRECLCGGHRGPGSHASLVRFWWRAHSSAQGETRTCHLGAWGHSSIPDGVPLGGGDRSGGRAVVDGCMWL